MYMVRSVHSFTFDPHVHDLLWMHSSVAHVLDSLYDNLHCADMVSKLGQLFELLPLEAFTLATLGVGVGMVQHDSSVVQMLVLKELVGGMRDITQHFPWNPGGVVYSLSLRLLEDKQFQGGHFSVILFCGG